MTLCKAIHNKENPYVIISKTITKTKTLSCKAKGIWLYAFSRPDDWTFYAKEIQEWCTDGRESLRAGFKELEDAGFLKRTRMRDEKTKRFTSYCWEFYEEPIEVEGEKEPKSTNAKATNGKPVRRESRQTENRPLLSNEYTKERKQQQLSSDKEATTLGKGEQKVKGERKANKDADECSVVVVSSSASLVSQDFPGLTEKGAADLLRKFKEEEIRSIHSAYHDQIENIINPPAWITRAIEREFPPPKAAEDPKVTAKNNRKWLLENSRLRVEETVFRGVRISVQSTKVKNPGVEFVMDGQGTGNYVKIEFSDAKFREKTNKKLADLGVTKPITS